MILPCLAPPLDVVAAAVLPAVRYPELEPRKAVGDAPNVYVPRAHGFRRASLLPHASRCMLPSARCEHRAPPALP
eukprot:scaffold40507_cov35-Tisochrysis_lutea.AAC.2